MHLLFIIFILIDQVTKTVFAGRDFFLLGLHLHPIRNYGLPFGFNFGGGMNFMVLILVYAVVGWLILRMPTSGKWQAAGKSMFLAGAASNLADRIIYGYVRDFIDISLGFVFNVADIFIVLGLLILLFTRSKSNSVDNPLAARSS
jgi:signal peptidase II